MSGSILVLGLLLVGIVAVLGYFGLKSVLRPKRLSELEAEIAKGNTGPSIRTLRAILEKSPDDHNAHRLLGQAYFKENNLQMAVAEFRAAERGCDVEQKEFEIDIRTYLAKIYQETSELKQALEELLLLTKLDEKNKNVFFQIGKIYQGQGSFERAARFFKQATSLDRQFTKAFLELGTCLYELQSYKDALAEFTQLVSIDKKNYSAYFYLGMIYKNLQDVGKALEYFEISERDPQVQHKAINEKALCHLQLGNIPKVIEELSRGLKSYAKKDALTLNMRYTLAQALEMKNDLLNAIDQWEKINAQQPNFRDVSSKLNQYVDLRKSDHLKDYICAPMPQFQKICSGLVQAMDYVVHDVLLLSNENIKMIARESSKMVATKALLKMFVCSRSNQAITEKDLREALDEMKKANATLVVYCTTNQFTNGARAFASTRPIELVDPKRLTELLTKAGEMGYTD